MDNPGSEVHIEQQQTPPAPISSYEMSPEISVDDREEAFSKFLSELDVWFQERKAAEDAKRLKEKEEKMLIRFYAEIVIRGVEKGKGVAMEEGGVDEGPSEEVNEDVALQQYAAGGEINLVDLSRLPPDANVNFQGLVELDLSNDLMQMMTNSIASLGSLQILSDSGNKLIFRSDSICHYRSEERKCERKVEKSVAGTNLSIYRRPICDFVICIGLGVASAWFTTAYVSQGEKTRAFIREEGEKTRAFVRKEGKKTRDASQMNDVPGIVLNVIVEVFKMAIPQLTGWKV